MSNNNWEEKDNHLIKEFTFDNYMSGVEFTNKVAKLAEEQNHHPEITINYKKVMLSLTSHDVGGKITDRDHKLAEAIDDLG